MGRGGDCADSPLADEMKFRPFLAGCHGEHRHVGFMIIDIIVVVLENLFIAVPLMTLSLILGPFVFCGIHCAKCTIKIHFHACFQPNVNYHLEQLWKQIYQLAQTFLNKHFQSHLDVIIIENMSSKFSF